MVIDPTTDVGKIRLRIGDYLDIQILPDIVIENALSEKSGNIVNASILCAQYILAALSRGVHERLQMIEVYGNQAFDQYLEYLKFCTSDPNFISISPLIYSANPEEDHPIIKFRKDFNGNFIQGTQSEDMAYTSFDYPYNRISFDLSL